MSKSGLRPRRVAGLIKAELGRFLIAKFQDPDSGFLAVTRVEMTADLLTARVYLSVFGGDPEGVLDRLHKARKDIRRNLASRLNLKYNPQLVFALDPVPGYENRMDRLIESVRKRDHRNS
jgi:ribosome-binding factor A